ncbi:hypothetical protein P261_00503 [Lachnospiraceae bacterium TWA4]|nr:hypothetical protein P261_00503 [Lachnospiraceae bacterium TWA4]
MKRDFKIISLKDEEKENCIATTDKHGNTRSISDYGIEQVIKAKYKFFILGGSIYIYQDGAYFRDNSNVLESIIKAYIPEPERFLKSNTVSRIHKLFIQSSELWVTDEELNNYPKHWIAFQDGLFDLLTEKFHPNNPDYRVVNQIPYKYSDIKSAADEGNVIENFLDFALSPEDKQSILEFCGYCMSINTSFQKFIVLTGNEGTGKSLILSLLQMAIGRGNHSNIELQSLEEKFNRIQLLHKLVNICADINADNLSSTSSIKLITGEDYLTDSHKGKDLISFKPYAKLFFSANELPKIHDKDSSDAFYRRLILVEMNNQPKEKDPQLKDKLQANIHYFIKICLEAYKDALTRGYLFESANSKELLIELKQESNNIQWFCDECVILGTDKRVEQKEVYPMYHEFCAKRNLSPVGTRKFHKDFKRIMGKKLDGFDVTPSNRKKYYKGVWVKESEAPF